MRLILLGPAAIQNKRLSQQSIATGGTTVNDFALIAHVRMENAFGLQGHIVTLSLSIELLEFLF